MKSLEAVLAQARACQLCIDELPHGVRPVLQAGEHARILIAGQAPGRRVHASGIPFDDPSGVRLRSWLGVDEATFYDRQKIALLPMGFCYPGSGTSGDKPPQAQCAPAWRQAIIDALPQIKLTLVMGQYAMAWHLPQRQATLTETVRHWREGWPQYLPLPHPSPRNNRWLRRNPWFEAEVIPVLQQRVSTLLAEY